MTEEEDKFDFREMDKRTIHDLLIINGRLTKALVAIANCSDDTSFHWLMDVAQQALDNSGKDV